MKKVIVLALMLAAGLGGYWLGQQPDSPPVFDWMNRQADQLQAEGGTHWINETIAAGRDGAATMLSRIRGDGGDNAAREMPREDAPKGELAQEQPIPQCW
jgi:hypothetical protein